MPTLHGTLLKAAGLLLALTTAVAAQDYPTKPVRLIIPFPPGGSNDVVGRLIATAAERAARQAGGGGQPRAAPAASSAPRSPRTRRTTATRCSIISLAHAVNPWLYKLPYDPIKAFTPVAILARGPNVLVVNPTLPVQFGEGADRARQGEARRAAICLGRRRQLPASRRRAVQARGRRRHPARAVQGRRPGDDRRDRRPHQDDVQLAGADHAAHPARASCARSAPAGEAQSGAARRADDRGGRRARLRGGQLVGHRGAGRHARRRSSRGCTRTIAAVQTSPRCRSGSRPRAPRSCR